MPDQIPQILRPDQNESMLLRAVLNDDPVEAFEHWRKAIVIDDIEWPSLQLLPRLYRNLSSHGVKGTELKIARGLHRKVWYQNHLHFDTALNIFDLMLSAGIRAIPLKGLAMCIGWLEDPGMRQMGDVDFLVPEERVSDVSALLRENGWRPRVSNRRGKWDRRVVNYLHSEPYINSEGHQFDLHWTLFPETTNTKLGQELFEHTRIVTWKDREFHLLDDTHMLFQLCVHGVKPSSTRLQWISDAYTIIDSRKEPMNWDSVINLAEKYQVVLWLQFALTILNEHFPKQVGIEVVDAVKKRPVTDLERREVSFLTRKRTFSEMFLLKHHRIKLERATLGERIENFKNGEKPSFTLHLKFLTGTNNLFSLFGHYFNRFLQAVFGRKNNPSTDD